MSSTPDELTPAAKAAFDAFADAFADAVYWTVFDEDGDEEEMEELAEDCIEIGNRLAALIAVDFVEIASPRDFTVRIRIPEDMFTALDQAFDIKYRPSVNDEDF